MLKENIPSAKEQSPALFYRASAQTFMKIPDSRNVYWMDKKVREMFEKTKVNIGDLTISDGQTKTGDNDRFLRQHWEVEKRTVGPNQKWRQHPKGGGYRKWYGNVDWIIDWSVSHRFHTWSDAARSAGSQSEPPTLG